MKKSLKWLFLLVAAISLSILAACGSNQASEEEDNKSGAQVEENDSTNEEENEKEDENEEADADQEEEQADEEEQTAGDPLFSVENQEISDGNYPDLSEHIDTLKGLDEGTIVVKFNHSGEGVMSLISLSNKDKAAEHFHVYITPTALGSENRKNDENIHISAGEINLEADTDHTVAFVVSKYEGYKLFLNGELVATDTESAVKFFSNISEANSAQLGRTERAEDGNPYPFTGTIEFVEVYAEPLSDEAAASITAS